MARATWDQTWAGVARVVAQRSACVRAQVGAVLVKDNRIISTGYNGPASGSPAQTDSGLGCKAYCPRASSEPSAIQEYGFGCPSIHAEANAILYRRWGVKGMTLYVTHAPCADCAKIISAAEIERVVMLEYPPSHRPNPVPYLEACGIIVEIL